MQRPSAATLSNFGLFRFVQRTPPERLRDLPDQPSSEPADQIDTRRANERLVRELGLWETFLRGGERPTIRR
jgi:hypothetical protein